MPNVSQWKLRRLAPRAKEVYARHQGDPSAPWLAAFEPRLTTSADRVIELYDTVAAKQRSRTRRTNAGKAHSTQLLKLLRGWASVVSIDLPHVARGEFGDNAAVPDDIVSDVLQLIATVDDHEADTGNALAYADQMRSTLTAAIEAARTEWGVTGTATADLSSLQLELREACEEFNRHLVAFRVALQALVGSSHPDFQKLRTSRVRIVDEDDDEVGANLPEALEESEESEGEEVDKESAA